MFKRKLSEKLLLPINLLVVLGWLYRPAVFLQILLEGVFYDVIPLILLLCFAELRLLFLLQNNQRFYAAMKAYGKNPTWFYRRDGQRSDNRDIYCGLLSQSRSSEKMNEFRGMVKEHLRQGVISDFFSKVIDNPDYLKHDIEVSIVFRNLMEYRRRLYAAEDIWSGMMECSQSVGSIYQMTQGLNSEFLWPLCKIVDKMIILLMGDDYDKTFTEDELYEYGYPKISDEEIYKMEVDEW